MSICDTVPAVGIARAAAYEPGLLRNALEQTLAPFGGMERFVSGGDRVLLKPNLVMGRHPGKAVNTHPEIVRAVGGLVRDCGGRILVGDSPGIGSAARAIRGCGMEEAVRSVGGSVVEFTADAETEGREGVFDRAALARERAEADVVVNLPKFKTHGQALLTLSIKNCFGFVVGTRKLQWHFRAGHNEALFARMLLDVFLASAPDLSIMDAVTGMEGEGPTSGTPRRLGFVAAARDGRALDAVCCRIAGVEPLDLPVLRAAKERDGEGGSPWLEPRAEGVPVADLRAEDFRLPRPRGNLYMGPRVLAPFFHRWLTVRPEAFAPACTGCGRCAEICPAGAIRMEACRPKIDQKACIRCYCCHELCPESAMRLRANLLARGVARLGGLWR